MESKGEMVLNDPGDRPLGFEVSPGSTAGCFHCGSSCGNAPWYHEEKNFCCQGCLTVYELLKAGGLEGFYQLGAGAGVRVGREENEEQYRFLDEPAVRERLVDFSDERQTRVTLRLPAMHCLACVWLLENLCRLRPGLGAGQVNFPRKELTLTFAPSRVKLSEVVALLARLGYVPELTFSDLDGRPRRANRRLWLQLGVAGFAFGNIMLFSFPGYLGLEHWSRFHRWFGFLSFALSLPVVFFSATHYWRSAWTSVRQRLLNIEVPIALGLAALFGQSCYELWAGRGEGYFDSLAGLVFFLLCGKWFQQKSYDRLAFDRDFKSFFPLSVSRRSRSATNGGGEERVTLAQVEVGDRLMVRHGELLPADARLIEGTGLMDYSFVTGESDPVERKAGEHLYAGGRQTAGTIEVETVKPVSQSYLTSLWNQAAFRKEKSQSLGTLTNRVSRWFTLGVFTIALAAAGYWFGRDPGRAVRSFTAVLIVACPCALALSAPFALGTAQRFLAQAHIFIKNPDVLETLARTDAVVFDKTGTLTQPGGELLFVGAALTAPEARWVGAVAAQSVHPLSARISQGLERSPGRAGDTFEERPGQGVRARVEGHGILLGSANWLRAQGVVGTEGPEGTGSVVHLGIDGIYRGRFVVRQKLRAGLGELLGGLRARCRLALLSGDQPRDPASFRSFFGEQAELHFRQSPLDKLEFIRRWQRQGHTVCMVGDGLNDAGALRQGDVGVAVVEQIGTFSPASDVIMSASAVPELPAVLSYARRTVAVVWTSFVLSACYNAVGIYFAARGELSPVIGAILMPVSSVTVVAWASGWTRWWGGRIKWGKGGGA